MKGVGLLGGKKKMSASRLDWRKSGHRPSCDSLFNKQHGESWPGIPFPGTTAFACFPCVCWDRGISTMEQERKSLGDSFRLRNLRSKSACIAPFFLLLASCRRAVSWKSQEREYRATMWKEAGPLKREIRNYIWDIV